MREKFGQLGVDHRKQFYDAHVEWMTSLLKYNNVMTTRVKTFTQVKNLAVASLAAFAKFRRWRHITWTETPEEVWKYDYNKEPDINMLGEGELEGMDEKTWYALPDSKDLVDGDTLPDKFKPDWIRRVADWAAAMPAAGHTPTSHTGSESHPQGDDPNKTTPDLKKHPRKVVPPPLKEKNEPKIEGPTKQKGKHKEGSADGSGKKKKKKDKGNKEGGKDKKEKADKPIKKEP
ncbi:MAG: hypothetical protein GY738_04325, partial [Pseudoalteromonas sp.]|nr:hypothetical protein [Pseudoalteromonas sp.]